MHSPSVLIIESPAKPKGQPWDVLAALTHTNESLDIQQAEGLPRALELIQTTQRTPPSLILLCEPRPGIWTDRDLHLLRLAAPLARIVRLTGSWCEGQQRSGRPPAGSPAIAWQQAAVRLERELALSNCRGVLSAPLTATGEDLLLAGDPPNSKRAGRQRIAIYAPRAAQAEAWATLCRGLGYEVEIVVEHRGGATSSADAVLWDCDPRDLADHGRVQAFVERSAPAPVIAVCGFPRPDDVQSAVRHGVSAVLAKPLLSADLERHVSQLFGARGQE